MVNRKLINFEEAALNQLEQDEATAELIPFFIRQLDNENGLITVRKLSYY